MRRPITRFLSWLALLCAGLPFRAPASEGGAGAYAPGARHFAAGIVPSVWGLYLRSDFFFYSGSAGGVSDSGRLVLDLQARAIAQITAVTFVFPWTLFGANQGFAVAVPVAFTDVHGAVSTPEGTRTFSGKEFNIGDIVVTPVLFGWHSNYLHCSLSLGVYVPTGKYHAEDLANTGKNYWTLDPQFALTWLRRDWGVDLSLSVGYSFQFENPATRYDSGDVVHVDFALGYEFTSWFRFGVVGYAWVQVTADGGEGARFGELKSRVFGLGPIAAFDVPLGRKPLTILVKYYQEFDAVYHLEGRNFVITLAFPFGH